MLFNILNYFFVNTRGYLWILKKYVNTRVTDTRTMWGLVQSEYLSIK